MKPGAFGMTIVLLISAIFFGTMEMTVVVTALPTIGLSFPWAVNWLSWLIVAPLMAAAVAMPLGGKMADDWGIRKTFFLGIGLSTLGSLLGGLVGMALPKSMGLLIGLRALQGFGGGTFAPVGLKLISAVLKDRRRTQTIGLAGMVGPLAAVAGPNVGGFLVSNFPWQSIFLLNALAGLVIALLAVMFMREPGAGQPAAAPLDAAGIAVFLGVVVTIILALTLGRQTGFLSLPVIGLLALGIALVILLVRIEAYFPNPLLEPALFRTGGMGVILVLSFLQGLIMYSTLLFLSLYSQTHPSIRATPAQAGALLSPAALAQMMAAPLVGRLLPRVGYRAMAAAGTIVTAGSLIAMSIGSASLGILGALLLLSRVGATMTSIPLAAAGLEANISKAGAISGLRQLSNVLGGVVGPVALSTVFTPGGHQGVRPVVFAVMGLFLLLALPLTRGIPRQEADAKNVSER